MYLVQLNPRESSYSFAYILHYVCKYTAFIGLYTTLPSVILYGVWHTKGESVGGRILRNGRAIVLH